jgi:hypothetical protein
MSTTKVEPAAEPKQIRRKAIDKRGTREIPLSQFGRVRTLTSYGMTPPADAISSRPQTDGISEFMHAELHPFCAGRRA